MTVWDVQGHFLIQIPAVPLLWRLKRKQHLSHFSTFVLEETGNQALVFSLQNDYESVCACYICLTLPQEARSLKGRPLRVIAKKRQRWNRTYTKLPPPIFLLPWQMKTSLWIYPHLALPFLPFSIPPSSHTCSMQISSDGSESGHAEEPDACAGFTVKFIYL